MKIHLVGPRPNQPAGRPAENQFMQTTRSLAANLNLLSPLEAYLLRVGGSWSGRDEERKQLERAFISHPAGLNLHNSPEIMRNT